MMHNAQAQGGAVWAGLLGWEKNFFLGGIRFGGKDIA